MNKEEIEAQRKRIERREKILAELQKQCDALRSELNEAAEGKPDFPGVVESMDGKIRAPRVSDAWKRRLRYAAILLILLGLCFPFQGSVTARGRLSSSRTAAIKAALDGKLTRIDAAEGLRIPAGTVIGELDNDYLKAALLQKNEELENIHSQIELSKHISERLKALLDRVEAMGDAISSAELETVQREHDRSLMEQKALLEKQAQKEADVEFLQHQIECSRLVAPFSGVIVTHNLRSKRNAFISKGDVVCEMFDPNNWVVEVTVPQKYIRRVKVGQEARVVFPSHAKSIKGTVVKLADLTQQQTELQWLDGDKIAKKGMKGVVAVVRMSEYPPGLKFGVDATATILTGRRSLLSKCMHLYDP